MAIKQLFHDASIEDNFLIDKFSESLGLRSQPIEDKTLLFDMIKAQDDPWKAGKEILFLTSNQGPFLRSCPGTREYNCCGYHILHIGTYCTMDCAYCILQGYFHPPMLQYFVNHEDLMAELKLKLATSEILRIGTGEFTDSLIWEKASPLTGSLIELFSTQPGAVLELKTKTTAIDHFRNLRHGRRTILAWSLNTPRMIESQERGTASLNARLKAAARCQSWGYPLAFHFDPMVIYPGCEEEYENVLERLFQQVDPTGIVWISMGTMRFMPTLGPIIQKRFPDSDIVYGEFITGLDGKSRYFKPLRIRLYRRMIDRLRLLAPDLTAYFCMEDDDVWSQVFGFTPDQRGGLPAMLDNSALSHCLE